ncbi:MAG: DUF262 domain-containing protein [Burkholderiales bacterium]|nr:DUF262 domain-containing protein [Burkholderiales bacterium]
MSTSLQKEELASFDIEDKDQPVPPPEVVAYNELRSCADLSRMYFTGKLDIQPDFQREVVWKPAEQARFIDSLVKQLPIPSMCFSLDPKTQKWKVIDGLQRMQTITSFLGEKPWAIDGVEDIDPILRGKTNAQLRDGTQAEQQIYGQVEDLTIPVTVIRCSYEKKAHMRYLFMIFNRLNSGGVKLNNQEIRNCIYSGPFNSALKDFDKSSKPWKLVTKRIWGSMARFRSVEVLLRALAFSERLDQYEGNLSGFLNDYMHEKSQVTGAELGAMIDSLQAMASLAEKVLARLGGGKRSLTVVESILVGLLANLPELQQLSLKLNAHLDASTNRFKETDSYQAGARYAISSPQTVKERLEEAVNAFAV